VSTSKGKEVILPSDQSNKRPDVSGAVGPVRIGFYVFLDCLCFCFKGQRQVLVLVPPVGDMDGSVCRGSRNRPQDRPGWHLSIDEQLIKSSKEAEHASGKAGLGLEE